MWVTLGTFSALGLPAAVKLPSSASWLAAQHFRYPNSQVFAFDMKYGLDGLCKASGGIHYDMGREDSQLSVCPLPKTLMIGSILLGLQNGLKPSAHCKAWLLLRPCATKSRTHLSCCKESPTRTITEFCANVQDKDIRESLEHYTISGPVGSLLDAEEDTLSSSNFMVFEMEELMGMGQKNAVPVLLLSFPPH